MLLEAQQGPQRREELPRNIRRYTQHTDNLQIGYSFVFLADVINGKVNIVTVVEQLGPMLTDLNPEQRAKGTTILSNVLEKIPSDLLSSTQLNFICTFYADRLKDHHQV